MRALTATIVSGLVLTLSQTSGLAFADELREASDTPVLSGPVSDRSQARLQAGERVRVIVMLDISADTIMAAADDDPEGDYLRNRHELARRSVLNAAFPHFQRADTELDSPSLEYEAFDLSPGFMLNANAREIDALQRAPGVVGVYDNVRYRPMVDVSVTQIGARALWNQDVTGAGVSVAVLDTGVEKDHPMTGPAIIASACFNTTTPDESASLCPDGSDEQISLASAEAGDACLDIRFDAVNGLEGCFHGTHVASTVAGRTVSLSNGRQISGVARAADIVSVNVFSRYEPAFCAEDGQAPNGPCLQAQTSDILAALDWLYLNRDRFNLAAVNLSLGDSEAHRQPCSSTPYDRIMSALSQSGVAVVVSAGNDGEGWGLNSPACVESAISVAAVDENDVVADFSNVADYLDLLAPGVEIEAAYGADQIGPGARCQNGITANSEGWCYYFSNANGTSMAAPHVAGAFAQLRQAFPDASVADMLHALKITGEPVLDRASRWVHARIQVDAAHEFLSSGAGVVRSVSLDSMVRYDTRNNTIYADSFGFSDRLIRNTSGQPRTIRVVSKPSWLTTEFYDGSDWPTGDPLSNTELALGTEDRLRLRINRDGLNDSFNSGELVLAIDGSSSRIRLKVTARIGSRLIDGPLNVRFGPYQWVGDVDSSVRDIFRLVGLNSGPPAGISLDIERLGDRDGHTVEDVSLRCDLTVRPNRYSGNEYIIGAADLADCPRFDSGDVFIDVLVEPEDARGLRAYRFSFTPRGGITNFSFDNYIGWGDVGGGPRQAYSSPSLTPDISLYALGTQHSPDNHESSSDEVIEVVGGPFEWTYDASGALQSNFRFGPVYPEDEISVDVAIANASADGYAGVYEDCSLTIRPERRGEMDFLILSEDLADCGAFGRADLSFKITTTNTEIYSSSGPGDVSGARMTRFIRQSSGALTDFHVDLDRSSGERVRHVNDGLAYVEAGPFEWVGDSTMATANQFRIAGVAGHAITGIDVKIDNPANSGYEGQYSDCTLAIRPNRAGANDYLILQEDLADCGAFGRGDLSFVIRAPSTAFLGESVKIQRLGFGAEGDLTDFDFTHSNRTLGIMGPDGYKQVSFGPFEWVGDAQAGTQSVFRIAGLHGLPEFIDVSIDNATQGGVRYRGTYADCSITVRPSRAGENEYVIGAADFVDCGNFGRGDLSFRIRGNWDIFDGFVSMRRFAVTTSGGLTDF